ncbi:Orotate phosphoribosyltransferase [Streptomyces alboniger]
MEGPEIAGRRVLVVVEDTSTTGGSPLTAVEAVREAGAEVVGVATIVDRATLLCAAVRHVPESTDSRTHGRFDVLGAVLGAAALALVTYALIEARSGTLVVVVSAVAGLAAAVAFVYVEKRRPDPMMPLDIFASRQFTAVNLVTLCVYAAFGGFFFLAALQLQVAVGSTTWSPPVARWVPRPARAAPPGSPGWRSAPGRTCSRSCGRRAPMSELAFKARELDAGDELAGVRARFVLDEAVYLDRNSLGALPTVVPGRVEDVVRRQWASCASVPGRRAAGGPRPSGSATGSPR